MSKQLKTPAYDRISTKLVGIMSKHYVAATKKKEQIMKEALSIEEYEEIIEKTINNYNYNGHNFNPAYLPVIIAMALKEQEFQTIQDAAWNSLSDERPTKQNENAILKENLDLVYNFLKNGYDTRDISENSEDKMGEWGKGYDEGFSGALLILKMKINQMTEEEPTTTTSCSTGETAIEEKMKELAEKAERGILNL